MGGSIFELLLKTLPNRNDLIMCIGSNTIFAIFISINHILLIFKLHAYKPRKKNFININNLVAEIQKIKKIEKEIALNNSKNTVAFTKNII